MARMPRLEFKSGQYHVVMKCGNCGREVFNVTAYFLFCHRKRKSFLVGEMGKDEKCWDPDCACAIRIPKIFRNADEVELEKEVLTSHAKLAPDLENWFPFVPIIPEGKQKALNDTLTVSIVESGRTVKSQIN